MTPARRRPILVCFAGIDGSGKSEQARRLVEWMNGQGIPTRYVWNIFEPWLLGLPMKIARKLFLHRKDMFLDYDRYREARDRAFRWSRLTPVFHWLTLGEYVMRFAPKVRWSLRRGRTVVCDRYVFDAVIGLAANLHYPDSKVRSTMRSLLRPMPQPDLVILFDVPEEVAFRRKTDVPSVSYLRDRRCLYQRFAEEYGMKVLDGNGSIDQIQAAVRDLVRDCLASRGLEARSPVVSLAGARAKGDR